MNPKAKDRVAPALSPKRKRHRRAKLTRRITAITTIAVLALALAGFGAWMLLLRKPEISVQYYPMEYEELIRARAEENGIPPAYVAAVILAESSYDPQALSSADARGLMQLLPSTAEWIAGKFDETVEPDGLFDPDTNVKYGCWYLGFLMRRYEGDRRCASAAYHAGQGTVDEWLKNPEYSADGATLDVIPYSSTDTYVKRVLKYNEKYEQLYAQAN